MAWIIAEELNRNVKKTPNVRILYSDLIYSLFYFV